MADIETRSYDQLPEAISLSPADIITMQSPGGPAKKISVGRAFALFQNCDVALETVADLTTDAAAIALPVQSLAVVYANPDATQSGYWIKTSAAGVGAWALTDINYGYAASFASQAAAARDAAIAGASSAGYRRTLAAAINDFAVGVYFSSDDQDEVSAHPNQLRLYRRIAGSPFYEDQGDEASPVSRSLLAEGETASRIGSDSGSNVQADIDKSFAGLARRVFLFDGLDRDVRAAVEAGFTGLTAPQAAAYRATLTAHVQNIIDQASVANLPRIIEGDHPGPWHYNAPVEMKSNTRFDLPPGTTWKKIGNTPSRVVPGSESISGKDCVVFGFSVRNMEIAHLTVDGDRAIAGNLGTGAWTDTAAQEGIYFYDVSRSKIGMLTAQNCKNGFSYNGVYMCELGRMEAVLCKEYGFVLAGAFTASSLNNPVAYATAGGFQMLGALGVTLISPAMDLISFGRRPFGESVDGNDPFPGSGGQWNAPLPCFSIVASKGIEITGWDIEHSYGPGFYIEGSDVNIGLSQLFNVRAAGIPADQSEFRWLEIRGTARSNVKISMPSGQMESWVKASGRDPFLFFVENPAVQKLTVDGDMRWPNDNIRPDAITAGVRHQRAQTLLNLNSANLVVGGGTPFRKFLAGDTLDVRDDGDGGAAFLHFAAAAPGNGYAYANLPRKVKKGFINIRGNIVGRSRADNIRCRLVEINSTNDAVAVLHTITASAGSDVEIDAWRWVHVDPANTVRFDINALGTGEEFDVHQLQIDFVESYS